MKVILFGATGMVGQGVLRECLQAQDVETILVVGRTPLEIQAPKLRQWSPTDMFDYSTALEHFEGYDACFFCLGTSSSGSSEAEFTRLNHDLPLAAAGAIAQVNPGMIFVYVSGGGTDSTERGSVMWARVKGRTENELQRLGFKAVYALRPGLILPLNGAVSKTRTYRLMYQTFGWAFALVRRARPEWVLDTERMGQAMLQLVRKGHDRVVIESAAIHHLAMGSTALR